MLSIPIYSLLPSQLALGPRVPHRSALDPSFERRLDQPRPSGLFQMVGQINRGAYLDRPDSISMSQINRANDRMARLVHAGAKHCFRCLGGVPVEPHPQEAIFDDSVVVVSTNLQPGAFPSRDDQT